MWRESAAVAAAIIIALGLGQLGRQLQRTTRAAVTRAAESRTLLLVGEPILQGEPVRVVRMRVPASTLTGLGVRSATGDAAAHVDVDVIVGEDGIARAIRVGM
jgi:serine/threonine protein kinase HipA of HipAB toxin-antitoxin module